MTTPARLEPPAPAPHPPGWEVWAIQPVVGPVTWSARPDGAPAAVITGAASEADALAKITAYEADLPRHLSEVQARLCAAEMSNVGRDEHRTARALYDALCAVRDRLEEGT